MLVVDTSVAVKWVVPESGIGVEDGTEHALDLLPRGLIAPDCIAGEFANALYKKVQRGEIGPQQAREAIEVLPDVLNFLPMTSFVPAAFELSLQLKHPVYDCVFLVTAIRIGAFLVSADRKFVEKCRMDNDRHPIFALGEVLPGAANA